MVTGVDAILVDFIEELVTGGWFDDLSPLSDLVPITDGVEDLRAEEQVLRIDDRCVEIRERGVVERSSGDTWVTVGVSTAPGFICLTGLGDVLGVATEDFRLALLVLNDLIFPGDGIGNPIRLRIRSLAGALRAAGTVSLIASIVVGLPLVCADLLGKNTGSHLQSLGRPVVVVSEGRYYSLAFLIDDIIAVHGCHRCRGVSRLTET